jgi:hypothetical protein
MMISLCTKRPTRTPIRARRSGSLLVGATVAAAVLASGVASSQAAHLATASVCSKVSPASVSAIVGYSVPAPIASTSDQKATSTNYEISSVDTSCDYGIDTSTVGLKKAVLLNYSIQSKALTPAEIQASFKRAERAAHAVDFKIVSYSGLGVSGYYITEAFGGFSVQIIAGVDGTRTFSAAVYSKTLSQSKLAALARLAENL